MTKVINMTSGNIKMELLLFSAPLIVSNIFQQLYNTIDTLFAITLLDKNVFAALGIAGSVMNLFIFILIGFCSGISNLLACYWGANNLERFQTVLATTLLWGGVLTLLMAFGGIFFLNRILTMIQTPAELLQDTKQYLTVIFSGLIFIYLYNLFSAVFRAIGDSNTPLTILIISMALHVVLGYVFVEIFHFRVVGLALGTVISQVFSVILCAVLLFREYNQICLSKKHFEVNGFIFKLSAEYGCIASFQQSSIFIGKILIQAIINRCGINAIAAYTACATLDSFVSSVGSSGDSTMSVFIGQNAGNSNQERIREGFKEGSLLFVFIGVAVAIILLLFPQQLLSILIAEGDAEVLKMGVGYVRAIALFYIITYWSNIMNGYLRGIGKIGVPFIGSSIQIFFRVVISYFFISSTSLTGLSIASGVGWSIQMVFLIWAVLVSLRQNLGVSSKLMT